MRLRHAGGGCANREQAVVGAAFVKDGQGGAANGCTSHSRLSSGQNCLYGDFWPPRYLRHCSKRDRPTGSKRYCPQAGDSGLRTSRIGRRKANENDRTGNPSLHRMPRAYWAPGRRPPCMRELRLGAILRRVLREPCRRTFRGTSVHMIVEVQSTRHWWRSLEAA